MSNIRSQTLSHLPNSDERLLDKQMAAVIEAIMIQSYSLANGGVIPSPKQTADYIHSLDNETLLEKIRQHPGAAATRAMLADDAELLRWAALVGQEQRR